MPTRSKSKSRAIKSAAAAAEEANESAKRIPLTLRFYGDEFVFDTVSGMFYVVSRTAGFIFRALDAGIPPDKLADEVQQRYGITRSAAARDIAHLLDNLSGIEPLGMVRA
jgi:hypothetical protein